MFKQGLTPSSRKVKVSLAMNLCINTWGNCRDQHDRPTVCRNFRQKRLSPQHIEHGKDFTDETWTENCPELDTNLHSIVQLSTEITEKTQEQFFESSQEHEEDPVSSQSTSSMYMFESSEENLGSGQCSSYIPNESQVKNPLRALNSFLAEVDISPVKKIQSNLLDACDRTKRRYISKAKTCLNAMLDSICPGEGDNLFELITPSAEREDNVLDEAIQESYNSTETWTLQRQLLSILAVKKSYNYVNHLIPGVTCKSGNFIDFITSSNIIQDMPFGEKTMKLSTGKVIPTPNVIRCIAPAAIVRQYDQYCDENSIDPLGGRAFADLNSVVSQLQIPKSDSDKILKDLSNSKRYLKCDYKECIFHGAKRPHYHWELLLQSKCQSTSDTYKNLYAVKVTEAVGHCFNLSMNAEETADTNTLMKGWALKSRKAHVTFSTDQKKFLNEKFQIGQITGKKEDPVSVSLEMQSAVLNGMKRFKREEFLVPQQIASYFSRYSRQINSKYNDGIAAKSENETSIITQEVLANINADK
ncbi:unnamed protein product [Mytilus coruscus]|uniref:Uncharacterized protein n=1 Tax=Mytilus coruscus TaxID=42192 RepID=A0A6J8DKZ7_MYTCO|nr:unnamed protein product [Mytilus coruscus]